MTETIQPLAYGLLNVETMKLRGSIYVRETTAQAAAADKSSRFATLTAIPLFGPDALVTATEESEARACKAEAQAAASAQAETSMRGEVVVLRNEIAALKGQLMMKKHGIAE